ncbi:MAG: hypothetical protein JJE39_09795 [Vicinamibacteria bacterium]|nr:hypothetical protein [Vicinamibacteria bacterium]
MTAWLAAMESGELMIPSDVHDREAWNGYWHKQIAMGPIEQGFNDAMSSDPTLVALLHRRGARKILCAGIGLSSESLALALHGFDVTSLDISDVPGLAFHAGIGDPAHPFSRLPIQTVKDDGTVIFLADQVIDPDLCPRIHGSEEYPSRGGGSLSHSTGDLVDPEVCPGPYDVLIERRTVQLFPEAEHEAALNGLAARLGPRALFISHQHLGSWRPGQPRRHFASDWLEASDFTPEGASEVGDTARVARLQFSTG